MPDLLERLKSALADRYAVDSEIGRGGMAVVFLAEDLRHDRRVAIKVLHPELTATLAGERFLREIKTVAGLQHPHVLPLYDSGEADGLVYFVMPFAEGESLRQRLDRQGQLAVDESIRIAVEVADGLDYAHRQGVIHRDIKPDNILLAEGHATIADFGIARAVEVAKGDRMTSTGLGVGTPLYASPEQATGQETLDGRTDVYSLGCVLYEMLAGEPPLTGATPKMTQARRLSETPTPLQSVRETVPPHLDQVIGRALARVPADRYTTAAAFGQALDAVLLTITSAAHPPVTPTGDRQASRPASKRIPLGVGVPLVAATAVVIGGALWFLNGRSAPAPLQITVSNTAQVTSEPGVDFDPAISPDGREVAYVENHSGEPHIVVRSTIEGGGGGELRPAAEVSGSQRYPRWTSDGAVLRFWSCPNGSDCDWKEVGKLGGFVRTAEVPRRTSLAWSQDGTRAVFGVADSIFAVPAAGGEREFLAVHVVDPWDPHSFAWSPDGRWIAYVNSNPFWLSGPNVAASSIWILDATGGEPMRVTDEEHLNVSPQWLPDSRHLLFVSDREGARGIYVVGVGPDGPSGSPRSVVPSSDAHSISVSADGRKLAYSRFIENQNIWSIPIPSSGTISIREAVQVTTGNQVVELHALSPDGEWIVFDSRRQGENDIYKQRLDGGSQQLVADFTGHAYDPDWSPGGSEIAFEASGGILVVSADGGTPEVAADFPGYDGGPSWSPDGLTIAFDSEGPRAELPNKMWIVSRDSVGAPWHDPVQLSDFGCGWPDWAPDGESLVCYAARRGWWKISRHGEVLYDSSTTGLRRFSPPRFSPDGSRIYFSATHDDGREGLWWIPAGGGDATLAVAFDDPMLEVIGGYLTVGPENLYLTIAQHESDIRVVDLAW
jgi:serine/threonine-protein kinase